MPMWLKSDGKLDGFPVRGVGATAVGITGMFIGASEFCSSSCPCYVVSAIPRLSCRFALRSGRIAKRRDFIVRGGRFAACVARRS